MTDVKNMISLIETKSNEITTKLEILRTLEDRKSTITTEINKIKGKLENGEITKFTYTQMLEVNKKSVSENTDNRKKIWNEIAELINKMTDELTELKDSYNQIIAEDSKVIVDTKPADSEEKQTE
jgi:hypothetical protein